MKSFSRKFRARCAPIWKLINFSFFSVKFWRYFGEILIICTPNWYNVVVLARCDLLFIALCRRSFLPASGFARRSITLCFRRTLRRLGSEAGIEEIRSEEGREGRAQYNVLDCQATTWCNIYLKHYKCIHYGKMQDTTYISGMASMEHTIRKHY